MAKVKYSKSKTTAKKLQSTFTNTTTAAATPPNWPPFKPALPIAALDLQPPVPGYADKILVAHNFFPKSLCRDYVTFLNTLPLITTPGRPKRGEAVRVNDRYQIDDARFAQRLWLETGLKGLVLDDSVKHLWGGEPVGLNPSIRIYRYTKGQYFDAHYDDYNLVTLPSTTEPSGTNTRTVWTILLYLTSAAEGCIGGETVFYPHDRKVAKEEIAVGLETGMLLLHKHGEDCLLHEGREVLDGEKWVLRTDLCVRR
ncbi:uncharacterized protein BCR38DRAFT_348766 [Pseudomassariella vexata]|uniref:Fe2OG dioxygenase domain-containing protein n=1 Tax=Pseudomassariella vexata TaxID=1141098 RepID=A0A1Y2DMM4_9PEZI|nr:uncharacterized protein BCR38DRAFT_348766 [Pseudomassariella vexata]ORY60517.1 hypothetical protein BCR38DRAFT_348766 [Pseudomassariella vexata]